MSYELTTSETQYNFLKNSQFQLVIPRLPNVSFYTVNTGIPDFSVDYPTIGTPFKKIPVTGETADFGDLVVRFIVDHKMNNYYEVYNWMRGYSRVNNYENIRDYIAENNGNPDAVHEKHLTSDIQFVIMSDRGCEIARVEYKDAFPISLSGLDMTTQVSDVEYLVATATFKYSYYEIVK
jgi:hypothetical protein